MDVPEIDAETLWWLREHLLRREEEIVTNLLQTPDYPPLPACPSCQVNPEEIRHDESLVAFKPCGHRFRITEAVKMELRP